MQRFKILNPLEFRNWDDLVANQTWNSPFHGSGWARTLAATYGYTPYYLTQFSNERLDAVIPVMQIRSRLTGTRGVALPFSDFVLPGEAGVTEQDALLRKVADLGRRNGWQSFEFRGGCSLVAQIPVWNRFYIHDLDLDSDSDKIWCGLSQNTRRNIKRAKQSKVTVTIDQSWQALQAFVVLNGMTRRKHGLPPQPKRFFRNLYDYVIRPGNGVVVLAKVGGASAAAAVFLHVDRTALYKYGASHPALNQTRANHLVMWSAMEYYAAAGVTRLNFGRTDLDHSGLRRYKLSWGAREKNLCYYKFDLRARAYLEGRPRSHNLKQLLAKMPQPVLRLLGEVLYKHAG